MFPGALATRLLEERREKFIAATLMAIAIPCMAQIAMIVGLVGQRGGEYVAIIFFTLFVLLVIKGLILNRVLKGASPEILVEIPPYRIPQIQAVIKKLWMRLSGFLKEALPLVLLGVLFVNVLYTLKIIDFFADIFTPVLTGLWGLPKEAISALIVGFLRKDVAVGMLGPLNLIYQAISNWLNDISGLFSLYCYLYGFNQRIRDKRYAKGYIHYDYSCAINGYIA